MIGLAKGIQCKYCNEVIYNSDELIFLLNNEVVVVCEKYPDWDTAICITCSEKHEIFR